MSTTELHIQSLANAAAALGEQCVTTIIAGCVVTISARHFGPDTAPASREELVSALCAGSMRSAGSRNFQPSRS